MVIISHNYHTLLKLKLLISYFMTNLVSISEQEKKLCNSKKQIIILQLITLGNNKFYIRDLVTNNVSRIQFKKGI